MRIEKRTKLVILACCIAIVVWDLGTTIFALVRSHDKAKEYVMNVPAGSDPTDYALSRAKNAEDSLFLIIKYRKYNEQGISRPTLSNLMNVMQNDQDISFQAHCEVFLTLAKTSEDTAFVQDVMRKPFEHSTPKYYHEEIQKRISMLKCYFNKE